MASALPTVSIVIPAYNEEATIADCVAAALEQTSPAHEILVIDNLSTDRTVAIVEALQRTHPDAPIRLLRQDQAQGLIPTRDFGLDAATGEVLARIDADSVLEPDWIAQAQRIFSDETVGAATGPVAYYDMPLRRFGQRTDDRLRRAILRLAKEYHFLFGSNMALRASAWRDIRGVVCRDEADEFHEDIDLSIHLFERGHRVVYDSDLVAGMSARRLDDNPRQYYHYVGRWERTYAAHAIRNPALRAPMVVFATIYPLVKGLRDVHQRTEKLRRMTAQLTEAAAAGGAGRIRED
ncbi:glycosyltransferase family 2 protein [Schumannella luteola]|uniref:Glycosyltransferase involved in cell wall biosynthesis n=1 Tax=Schumannella luteola TaxID=472059 RepID=A0A852YKE6_9MICO|nr:glycosyltransferase family 2 protein [Schumannella luteola]NYH00478.1 glycosyltransferase involved in cell wall biosynthesis [Schumannella luteola]TPX06263.1 glycosyltransferase family 2 protein [Schumannella luteola]